ncbi:MAG: VWA domain-containing protein [Clostridia bacterium]|nr:VWA domain-containing protein [Clostridia bacterium]
MLQKNNLYKFSTTRINVFSFNADSSGSMRDDRRNMIDGLESFKKSFENFSEANSIAVALNTFDNDYYPSAFRNISEFRTDYYPSGGTALYHSIVQGANDLLEYIQEVILRNNCIPRATFIVLSDGMSEYDKDTEENAKKAIAKLNKNGVTTVFVAFGRSITAQFGSKLGFVATRDINDRSALTTFMGEELSRSCKEQSRSMKSLGAEFFSQAAKNSQSAGYSAKASQVMDDEDWFEEV